MRVQGAKGHINPEAATVTGDVSALGPLHPWHLLLMGGAHSGLGRGPRAGGEGVVEELHVNLITHTSRRHEAWGLVQGGWAPTSPHVVLLPPPALFPKEQGSQSHTLFFFFFCFLMLHLQHMKVHRLGVKSELQLLAYPTATATLSKARDQTCVLTDTSRIHFRRATTGTL